MKKIITIILIIAICLSGCSTNTQNDKTEVDLENCEEQMIEIANKYGYETSGHGRGYLYIYPGNDDKITSSVECNENGKVTFGVEYESYLVDEESQINSEIFVELVNLLSEHTITQSYCDEFLNAPEEQYSASRYGYEKNNDEKIVKIDTLSFYEEEWGIYYTLYEDGKEVLYVYGNSKWIC